jgi:hypothetical protein
VKVVKLNIVRKILILNVTVSTLLFLPAQVFSQSANASLSGIVQDTSKGYIPGVTISATNINTGVQTTTSTNSTGAYTFPSLQPGMYEVSAELDGFQKSTTTDVALGSGAQSRLNLVLQVAGFSEEIEVATTAQDILMESSSSTGTVLESQQLIDLPLTSNDAMELVNIIGGVQPSQNEGDDFDAKRMDQSFAGVDANSIHIQQDGITINDVRYNIGIASSSRINTEMVSELKLILSPVDAEMGRGMGQIQILTKSGANDYHGSAVWNINNSSLDANTWNNNRLDLPLEWRNLNTYTLSFSGPIRKNRTFFFLTWDHAIPRTHSNRTPYVWTNCARKGIFRYFNGWNSGHYDKDVVLTGSTPTRPVVDINGVPLDVRFADRLVGLNDDVGIITTEPDGETPSSLKYVSVFGPLTETARAQVEADLINCSQYDPDYGAYDMHNPFSLESLEAVGIERYWEEGPEGGGIVYRLLDTQAIPNFTGVMPEANSWRDDGTIGVNVITDGLNLATHRWTRVDKGVDRIYGIGQENARKNITVKIDHNFSDRHRAGATYTYERDVNAGAQKLWPDGFEGTTERYPQRFSISLTSSLKPTLLNEARFGLNRNKAHSLNALDATANRDEIRALMQTMLPTEEWEHYPKGEPFVLNPQLFWSNSYASHFIGGADGSSRNSLLPSWGGYDHRWTMSDTLAWTKGRHSFKFGGEIRLTRSHQDADGAIGTVSRLSMPMAYGGVTVFSLPEDLFSSIGNPQISGLVGDQWFWEYAGTVLDISSGTQKMIQNLRDYHAGSIGFISQWVFINDPFDKDWNDINKGEITRILDIRQKEMAFFAKDDWKVTDSLTLNLGLRYEYYGVPWMDRGMSLALKGGSNALFGVTGRDFSTWMAEHPVNLGDNYLTEQEFVGPGSPQPDIGVFEKDLNNFGPAVGFAWQLPWFGKGRTTLRGGYQLSYSQIANADNISGGFAYILAGSTGTNTDLYYFGSEGENPYMRFADLDDYLPVSKYLDTEENPPRPLNTIDIKRRYGSLSAYDYHIVNPYTQSLNFSVSRRIGSNVTVDVRYIGTLARKGISGIDLNSANWLYNGLKEALDAARAGSTHELLDKLFDGVQFDSSSLKNTIAVGSPGGPDGGQVLKALYPSSLAEGDYNAIAGSINILNYSRQEGGVVCPYPFLPTYCIPQPGLNEDLPELGYAEQGSILRHADTVNPGEFPENFIVANPQVEDANWYTNLNHNNYHSMQVRLEVRPTHNFNITGTYTWSKNLGNSSYTNPNDRANPFDYTWVGNSRAHQLNTYGAWTLPFGAGGFFFRDVGNPIVRRFIEGWNLSWILSMNSGSRGDIYADVTHLYGNSVPNIVRPDLFNPKDGGHVTWEPGADNGYYFGDPSQYVFGPDLQCFDENLVFYDWHWEEAPDGTMVKIEDKTTSLRDDCIANMSALYIPMTETVKEWQLINNEWENVVTERQIYSPENVIMQHPMPGEYGNLGRNILEGPGSFSLDMALGKTVQLSEGKSIGFRVDAGNILNHPSPGGPNTGVSQNGNPLGYIGSKSGNRRFMAKITIRF